MSKILILKHQHKTASEYIVEKGEIAHNEQFLLFPQCFLFNQATVSQFAHIFDIISLFAVALEDPKIGLWGKWLMTLKTKPFKNNVEKGENGGNQHFSISYNVF